MKKRINPGSIRTKRAFTIVELIIVIAVIGVLAAILIPTFTGVIKKANYASCQSLVKDLNTAFVTETVEDEEAYAYSMEEAINMLKGAGCANEINAEKKHDFDIIWVGQIGTKILNRFAVVEATENLSATSILYPQEVVAAAEAMPERWFSTSNLQSTTAPYTTTTVGADVAGKENIKLEQDETFNGPADITGEWSLDLNGHDLTVVGGELCVVGGTLTIYDSKRSGAIILHNYSIDVYGDGMFVMNSGSIVSDNAYPFFAGSYNSATKTTTPGYIMINNGTVTSMDGMNYVVYAKGNGTVFEVNGGVINGVIGMNGQEQFAGVTVNINGGEITSVDASAIYFPNRDTLNITGGTLRTIIPEDLDTVADTINAKAGTINISGGNIICEAYAITNISTVSVNNNGAQPVGSALGVVTNDAYGYQKVGGVKQYDPINVTITGGTLRSLNGYALTQSLSLGSKTRTVNVNIYGGTFIGANSRGIFVDDDATAVTVTINPGISINIER